MKLLPLLVAVALLASSPALAQTADADALGLELDQNEALTLGADCETACRALVSMRRAAERLCRLDPGERCAAARERVDAAARRVRAACPSCVDARETPKAAEPGAGAAPPPLPAESPAKSAVEEEAPRKGGGCAGCSTAPPGNDSATGAAFLCAAIGFLSRRRRHGRR